MSFFIAITIWAPLGIPISIWLFNRSSGWEAAKSLPFKRRLRAAFSNTEIENIEDQNLRESVATFSKRFRVVYFGYIILPLISFHGLAYYVYAR